MLAQTSLQIFEGCRTTHCREVPRTEQKLSTQTTRVCLLMLIVYIWRGCYRSFVGKDDKFRIIYRRTQTLRIRLSRNATCCSWALISVELFLWKTLSNHSGSIPLSTKNYHSLCSNLFVYSKLFVVCFSVPRVSSSARPTLTLRSLFRAVPTFLSTHTSAILQP